MQNPSKSFWQYLKLSHSYGQLILFIFVPVSIFLSLSGGSVIYNTIQSQKTEQWAQANSILQRYQTVASRLFVLSQENPTQTDDTQHALSYIKYEKNLVASAIVSDSGQVLLQTQFGPKITWIDPPLENYMFGAVNDGQYNIYGIRINRDGIRSAWLMIALDNQSYTIYNYKMISLVILTILTALILLLICINLYARRWLVPIYEIRLELQRMEAEDLGRPLNTHSTGELALLQQDIEKLLQRINISFVELREHSYDTEEDMRRTVDGLELQNILYRRARDEAISSSQSKSVFLANISHELRTPLNSIDGFINLMLRRPHIDDENLVYLQTIHKSSSHLLALINDVLDFSKIDAGKLELEVAPFNLEEAMFDVMDMLSPLASEKGLHMAMYVDLALPPIVLGDPLRFKQILTNLISNAIKFTNEGEIVVHTTLQHISEDKVSIYCSVKDSGIGIQPNEQSKLFNSFQQGDTSITRQYGGTGLGLTISKQLVQMMKGAIHFENNQTNNPNEKGSTFWFNAEFELKESSNKELNNEVDDLSSYQVLSYITHQATTNILQQYFNDFSIRYTVATSILDLLDKLNHFNTHIEHTHHWIIIEHSNDTDSLLREIRKRYHGNIAVYGYQMQLDPKILQQYHATALHQPISRTRLKALLKNEQKNNTVPTFDGKGLHVLAVDDHLPNLIILEALLKEINTTVTTALSGTIALDIIQQRADQQQKPFDLIFMDIQMPIMSGIETMQAIRQLEGEIANTHHVPIVALTAHAMSSEKEKLLTIGFNDYVTKPIQMSQLINILENWTCIKIPNPRRIPKINFIRSKTSEDIAVLDWQKCLELAIHKEDLARDLLKMLVDSFEREQKEMQQLIQDEDFPQLEHNLHRLFGATRYVGAPELQHISGEFEQFISQLRKQKRIADDEFIQEVIQRNQRLLLAMQRLKQAAQTYIDI